MPGKVKVKILAGRNLPVMDRSSDTTDAYVEIKLGNITYKTDVCRKSLHPQWNSDWYKFEVDDSELQDEPLQIRLMDHDTYSANDAIGKVYLDLNPLLLPATNLLRHNIENTNERNNSTMSGWIPVYDTMHGIRGEVNIIVKVELFTDFNKFRSSSCGVQFFCSPAIPQGFYAQIVHGFVEELVVNDDPEYQWIDKIRTPRASNEARQTLFFKLSGELQRKIGLKALDLGGNAVIGYRQSFDLEGDSGIVARGIGTAVTLIRIPDNQSVISTENNYNEERAHSYVKFLCADKGFHLNKKPRNLPHLNKLFHPPSLSRSTPSPLIAHKNLNKSLSTGEIIPKKLIKQNTHIEFAPLPKPLIIQHSNSLQTLLKQEDMRGVPSTGLSQRLRNLKYLQIGKKLTGLKGKRSAVSEPGSSDVEKSQNKIKYPFRRTISDSNTMAEVLVRSVLHVHSSLDCIMEAPNPPQPTFRKQISLNESTQTKDSSYLSLPDDSFDASSNPSEISDSSSSDDEVSEPKETTVEYDTVSGIVKNVRRLSMLNENVSEINLTGNFGVMETCSESDIENSYKESTVSPEDDQKPWEFPDNKVSFTVGDEQDVEPENNSTKTENNLILQPIIKEEAKEKSLFKIGLEAMLLDKVNLMGTYTPPTSPSIQTPSKKFELPEKNESFFPKIQKTFENIRRNSTSMSLIDLDKTNIKRTNSLNEISNRGKIQKVKKSVLSLQHHDTVLGAPFISLRNKHVEMMTRNTKSNSIANSPTENEFKHRFTSLHNINIKTSGHHSFLTKAEKKVKDVIQTPFLLLQNLHWERKRNDEKKRNSLERGLLGTALQNVLRDTVNDILITSHVGKNDDKNDINSKNDSQELSIPILTPALPTINMEIEGITSANKLHASFSPFDRPVGSPQQSETTNNRYEQGHQRTESMGAKISQSPAKLNAISCIHRRSSDSDLSITPKGLFRKRNSLTGSDRSTGNAGMQMMIKKAFVRTTAPHENFEYLEYPFLTMASYPPGFICYLGGVVCARSVKLLERITNLEEPESRDTWWSEIRMEIRSHARSLSCNAVLNYMETTTICDDVCVLSASGTAAVIGFHYSSRDSLSRLPSLSRHQTKDVNERLDEHKKSENVNIPKNLSESPDRDSLPNLGMSNLQCSICHVPYLGTVNVSSVSKCRMCNNGKVPEVLITTIEIPEGIPIIGRGCFLQSYVCRPIKELKGESYAKEISDGLPFLEYELHRILINKLKVKGMNAVFGLKVRISIGEKMVIGIATATAVFLSALPTPPLPKLVSDRSSDDKKLANLQKELHETVQKNKEVYQIKSIKYDDDFSNGRNLSDTEESEDEQPIIEINSGKDCCVLEIEDPEDAEVLNLLIDARPPDGFHVVNTEVVPGLEDLEIVKNLQMFIQICREKIQPPYSIDKSFHRLLETVYFKLRRMIPCALCDLQFRVESPEPDEIQLCVVGMALGLGDPPKGVIKRKLKPILSKRNEEELIFNLEEINQIPENSVFQTPPHSTLLHGQLSKHRQKSPQRKKQATQRHMPHRERHGVDITPLSYVPGGQIERYLGKLNFFFIRETTSIREEGGTSGFIHSFITEILAIVRAHVTALGGNAMVAYFMTECVLNHNPHKNQGQCLINIGGDVVHVSYYSGGEQ
nr:C2 domain-containing protein 5 isoform X1 [Onthophagus taurus]XP_022914797.1 C2 domain-containing protein 5 isoform X1 [Onthophagus taurus]